MSKNALLPCPCCGLLTIEGPIEAYGEWCSECHWEIDPEAVEKPDEELRPNYMTLNDARILAAERGPLAVRERNQPGGKAYDRQRD